MVPKHSNIITTCWDSTRPRNVSIKLYCLSLFANFVLGISALSQLFFLELSFILFSATNEQNISPFKIDSCYFPFDRFHAVFDVKF